MTHFEALNSELNSKQMRVDEYFPKVARARAKILFDSWIVSVFYVLIKSFKVIVKTCDKP